MPKLSTTLAARYLAARGIVTPFGKPTSETVAHWCRSGRLAGELSSKHTWQIDTAELDAFMPTYGRKPSAAPLQFRDNPQAGECSIVDCEIKPLYKKRLCVRHERQWYRQKGKDNNG